VEFFGGPRKTGVVDNRVKRSQVNKVHKIGFIEAGLKNQIISLETVISLYLGHARTVDMTQ
jgi:hypothetical protein